MTAEYARLWVPGGWNPASGCLARGRDGINRTLWRVVRDTPARPVEELEDRRGRRRLFRTYRGAGRVADALNQPTPEREQPA